ncbi:YtxH domain-containing protein [Streptococcus ovuberis]|uniref:YtxH domain-containing protein n=1 Tax=Streptococcus ovuberis TaxID=1936207 RepID=A0A7X6S1S7_9STRE|nr:YtxH domain-containing protein [Streptococcus ovuberis]NKZ21107.1 YtxH domain-containing protein [Streptococcus ovuberis]
MSKPNKILTTLILGAAGGAAAAVFLASKTGKAVKNKLADYLQDYQENPEAKYSEWVGKAQEIKDQALEKYTDVKHKFETGELTADDIVKTVKDKADELKERVSQEDFFAQFKDQATKAKADAEEVLNDLVEDDTYNQESISEDITIDLNEVDLLADEVLEDEPGEETNH